MDKEVIKIETPNFEKRFCECGKQIFWKSKDLIKCYECWRREDTEKKYIESKKERKFRENLVKDPPTDEEYHQICFLLATFTKTRDISKYFTDIGRHINTTFIHAITKSDKWKPVIAKYRQEWISKVTDVPIANKRFRLESYQKLFVDALEKGDTKLAKELLNSSRNEMEEQSIKYGNTNYSMTYIADMSDETLIRKREEILKKIKSTSMDIKRIDTTKQEVIEPIVIEKEGSI